MNKPGRPLQTPAPPLSAEQQMAKMSRRSFALGAIAVIAAGSGWEWLRTRPEQDGIPWPFRRALAFDEKIARSYFRPYRLAQTYPVSMAREVRPNGDIGVDTDLDLDAWRLTVNGVHGASQPPSLTMADIKTLPHFEMVTEHRCVEGWSTIVHWGGARFADFAAKYPPQTRSGAAPDLKNRPEDLAQYVGFATPDGNYYVGLEMEAAPDEHGAPLRLVVPIKYGIKSIKRIGSITYSNARPADYWAEQGYDWYAGH
jgi:hypothetical protein